MADAVKALLASARASEARGETDAASEQYEKAGYPEEAARLLMAGGQLLAAAAVYLRAAEALSKQPARGGERRRLLRSAAVCLARGGQARRAAELFTALGDHEKASELLARASAREGELDAAAGASASGPGRRQAGMRLEKSGQLEHALAAYTSARLPADAGRVARKLGRLREAAELFEDAMLFYEAAVCFWEAGDKARCLEDLVRVSREHKMYRACCVRALAIASEQRRMSLELDQFLTRFVASAPESEAELQAFARAGKLYESEGFPDSACELYRRMLAARPDHPVGERLQQLEAESKGSKLAFAKILQEDAAFLGQAPSGRRAPAASVAMPAGASGSAGLAAAVPAPVPAAPVLLDGALQAGALIANRYRIDSRIGQGGMAAIYRALDTELDEAVAIKVFAMPTQDPEALARFKQELAVARKLSHPNIVRLHDIGVHQGCRFITMELLAGEDLGRMLQRARPSLARALELLSQACAGLQLAHERGVIHRDIKPENLFLTDEGVLKVMDFGIAKDLQGSNKTRTGMIAGTPAYMSPEQISGFTRVTPLTDIYALGVVAYQMCTGDVPFSHPEMMPTLMMHLNEAPVPPARRNPDIPPALDALILRLLEKEPDKRVQSCRELAGQLDAIRAALA